MQLLAVNFNANRPNCPACQGRLHRHGHYARRRRGQIIPRWFCIPCQRTFSILPSDLLPYRGLSCAELQNQFDRWAFEDHSLTSTAAVAALRSFLEPKVQRELQHACGQLLDEPRAQGQALWRGIRRFCPSVGDLLRWLANQSGLSLLGRYVCHRESADNGRTAGWMFGATVKATIPHNFSFPNHMMAPSPGHGFG